MNMTNKYKNAVFLLFLATLFIACNLNADATKGENITTSKKTESPKALIEENIEGKSLVLDFPIYSDSIVFINCDNDIVERLKKHYLQIWSDTIIDLKNADGKMDLQLQFHWSYVEYNDPGIDSISLLINGEKTSSMDLVSYLEMEPFENLESGLIMRSDLYFQDINMDGYLDFAIRWACGKGCYDSFWIFDNETKQFEHNKEIDYLRPIAFDCQKNIFYSYQGGGGWYSDYEAYKMDENGNIQLFQKKYFLVEMIDEHTYQTERYVNSQGALLYKKSVLIN